ncbi:MAG: glycosyltransferase family 4 protein [bacterium]
MKIAYILGGFPSTSETFIMNEIIQLISQGLEIEVYSIFQPIGAVLHLEIIENQLLERTFYFRYRNILKLKSKYGFLLKFLKISGVNLRGRCTIAYFAQLAKERGINHVHSHFIHHYGEAISRTAKIPYSFTAHCFEEKGMSGLAKKKLKGLIEYALFVVAASEFVRNGLSSMVPPEHKGKIRTIYCGIRTDKFKGRKTEDRPFTINCVGIGTYPSKGGRYLIEALNLIRNNLSFKAFFIGDGSERIKLEKISRENLLEEHITFTGKLTSDQVLEYHREADCFVLPCVVMPDGQMDGLPVSIMEAMAMGLPVISTPVAGIPELVIDGETGLLVPERDSRALAVAIMRLYDDTQLRELIGKRARQKVVTEFNLEKTGQQLAKLYQQYV